MIAAKFNDGIWECGPIMKVSGELSAWLSRGGDIEEEPLN